MKLMAEHTIFIVDWATSFSIDEAKMANETNGWKYYVL